MKIITYSDLHFEFGTDFMPPPDSDADLMILAGDIITFKDYRPLAHFLKGWAKPVLYVTGNHEYYTRQPMDEENACFKSWLAANHPNVTLLQDEAINIGGVHFFGGTMWTDFHQADTRAMMTAQQQNKQKQNKQTEPLPAIAGRFILGMIRNVIEYGLVGDITTRRTEVSPRPESSSPVAFA